MSEDKTPKNIPLTEKPEVKIEGNKINEALNYERDINKGFSFEAKPLKPIEKPRTDSEQNTSE